MGFEKNALVYTADGVRRIGEILPGDFVLGYDGEYHIVQKATISREQKPITFTGDGIIDKITCGRDTLIYTREGWKNAVEIEKGEMCNISAYYIFDTPIGFPKNFDWEMLGYIFRDMGYLSVFHKLYTENLHDIVPVFDKNEIEYFLEGKDYLKCEDRVLNGIVSRFFFDYKNREFNLPPWKMNGAKFLEPFIYKTYSSSDKEASILRTVNLSKNHARNIGLIVKMVAENLGYKVRVIDENEFKFYLLLEMRPDDSFGMNYFSPVESASWKLYKPVITYSLKTENDMGYNVQGLIVR